MEAGFKLQENISQYNAKFGTPALPAALRKNVESIESLLFDSKNIIFILLLF